MPMNFDPKKTLFLIDGSSFLYRAYYGTRPLHTKTGIPVQAVYSFCRMIKKLIDTFKPEYMVVVWDSKGKTTRHEMFPEYKAQRQAPPSDLFEQKALIVEFADAIGMPQIATVGIEADDIMFSLGQEAKKVGMHTVLITSDKDMGQMLDTDTTMFDPFKDAFIDVPAFKEKMGFGPEKLPFYFALLGDASDNIPGVKGIGQKGATDLTKQFASLEDLYKQLDKVGKEKMRQALQTNKENAFLSYKLFLLQYHPTNKELSEIVFDGSKWPQARPIFEKLEFSSLLKGMQAADLQQQGIFPEVAQKMANYNFITITTPAQLQELCTAIKQKRAVALDTETDGVYVMNAQCIGISACVQEGTAYYIPLAHQIDEPQLSKDEVKATLGPMLADATIKKYFHNAKFDLIVLANAGLPVMGTAFDTLLAASLTNKEWQRIGLKYLSEQYFGEPMLSFKEVVSGDYKTFAQVPLELATRYAAADAHQTWRLKPILQEKLQQEDMVELYNNLEFPFMPVLTELEMQGIICDAAQLETLNVEVTRDLQEIEKTIIDLVGDAFKDINLNSPRQVENLLFNELKLPPQKKSAKRTGYSTDNEVLQTLAQMHAVPEFIIRYRELFKLKSTYIESLPTYVNPTTGKIHSNFSQTLVATGRLSSSEPNLQNIPADGGGYGIEIRAAFKPEPGHVLMSADYSQIELRVLAYFSQDQNLLQAFSKQADIHSQTAALLFDVPLTAITQAQRQIGKRINFSILYGLTPYGLSQDLDISFTQAKDYIEKYFKQYAGVSAWMERIIFDAKRTGYVQTHWGRRRYVPAIYEKNKTLFDEAKRIAINTPVQGTAAEIMKIGMLNIAQELKKANLQARMILQIHDELLLTVPEHEVEQTQALIKKTLENVTQWNVPLVVNMRTGSTWKDVTK